MFIDLEDLLNVDVSLIREDQVKTNNGLLAIYH